ncbi:MAG: Gfo/Idh/MocA family oxidoreductase [Planctomycetota bacterium]
MRQQRIVSPDDRSSGRGISRREFVKRAAAAVAFPTIVPASALGLARRVAPSNRIVMGFIGVGSQGTSNMQGFLEKPEVQVVAVCDVDFHHLTRAKSIVDTAYGGSDCRAYADFRELLAEGADLDGVGLALPDQWHAIPAIAAARAGLDMYGEKPLARSIRESQAIREAVHRYGRIWQTGSWQRSEPHFRRACELVRNGRIGTVHLVEVGLPTGSRCGPKPVSPVPDGLDWEFWLGPAPWRPYCAFGDDRCHWDWRWIMDFSGGQLTDWAGHHIDIAHWGLGLDDAGPLEVEGRGDYPAEGLWDAPTSYAFTCTYAGGLTMVVANDQQLGFMGTKWHGDDGWVYVDRDGMSASSADLLREEAIGPGDIRLYESPGHIQNFLDCVKSRQPTITPVATACRSITVGHLGEIAMLTGRKIRWDPEREEILDDPGASALLGRTYRKPWVLC